MDMRAGTPKIERADVDLDCGSLLPLCCHSLLWRRSTTDLYRDVLASGTRARIVTVRTSKLDESYLGRDLAEDLLADFVARDVDPCGERGEYHTLVTSCPAFSRPLIVRALGRATNGGCVAEDLVLEGA